MWRCIKIFGRRLPKPGYTSHPFVKRTPSFAECVFAMTFVNISFQRLTWHSAYTAMPPSFLNASYVTHIRLALYGRGAVCIQMVTKMLMNCLYKALTYPSAMRIPNVEWVSIRCAGIPPVDATSVNKHIWTIPSSGFQWKSSRACIDQSTTYIHCVDSCVSGTCSA